MRRSDFLSAVIVGAGLFASPPGAAADLAAALGPRPTIPAPLARVEQRLSVREARKRMPALFNDVDTGNELTFPEYPGAKLSVSVRSSTARGTRVGDYLIVLPKARALSVLTKAWGKPAACQRDDGKSALLWWNAGDRVRASLEAGDPSSNAVSVELGRYTPLVELLGDGATFSFEAGRPVLGRGLYQVLDEHPEWKSPFSDSSQLSLPPTEWDEGECQVELLVADDGKTIRSFEVPLGYGDAASREAIRAAIERRFGKPKREGDKMVFSTAKRQLVLTEDARNRLWYLAVSPRP